MAPLMPPNTTTPQTQTTAAAAPLPAPALRALEQIRQRLLQLTTSLSSLQTSLYSTNEPSQPLPPWQSIQRLASILSQNLSSLTTILSTNPALLQSLSTYPLPAFPASSEEDLLNQLLRKKVEVGVEEAFASAIETARPVFGTVSAAAADGGNAGGSGNGNGGGKQGRMLEQLWEAAGLKVNECARQRDWEDEFTAEERDAGVENVKTGLRRNLDDDDDDDNDEGDKAFGNGGNVEGLKLDGWLRFGSTGRVGG